MSVDSLVGRLQRRQLRGSFQVASETAIACRQVVSSFKWQHIDQLLAHLKTLGKRLDIAQPLEFTAGNVVRKILKMIREVHADSMAGLLDEEAPREPSTIVLDANTAIHSAMLNLLGRPETPKTNIYRAGTNLRPAIIGGIQDIMDELTRVYRDIGQHSLQHIHSSEIIMTHGCSRTVAAFLRHAAESRKFTVIVTEAHPNTVKETHAMAQSLSQAGISIVLVPDSAVFALMSRVNKVILGTHVILQNGGLLATSGSRQICQAAQVHATPVVIVSGAFKLTPYYPYDHESLLELISPEAVLPFKSAPDVEIINPYFDYVEPELIALYITNLGAHAPTTLHRTMNENYDNEDYEL